jgi:hypothetical protein
MMVNEGLEELDAVFRAVRILDSSSIALGDEPPVPVNARGAQPQPGGHISQPADLLVAALVEMLYMRCYARPLESPSRPDPRANLAEEDPEFADSLARANQSQDRWDPCWQVLTLDPSGWVHVQKGQRIRSVAPGQYVLAEAASMGPQPGSLVHLKAPGGSHQFQPGFFVAFGETLGHETDDYDTVRIYFNVTAAAAPLLVKTLTHELNHLCVPFRLKCMNHPADYVRADAAVVYVALRYFQITAQIVSCLPESLTGRFVSGSPLFAKKLGPGISLAEDPRTGESFGQHRCRLVAEGLVDAWHEGRQDPRHRLQSVERRFRSSGLDLQRPYLNPGSVDVYTLPAAGGIEA